MTFQDALMTALVFLFGLLWKEALECKRDRLALRKRVEKLEGLHGYAKGQLAMMSNCRSPTCPFIEGQDLDESLPDAQ
jgi:hypothetical protein